MYVRHFTGRIHIGRSSVVEQSGVWRKEGGQEYVGEQRGA